MEGSRINLNLLGIKARIKKELYRLLAAEEICICFFKKNINLLCERHRSRQEEGKPLSSHFLCSGFLYGEVKPRSVQQTKGLRVEDFVYSIETEVDNRTDYLNQNYKEITLNSQWIVNLCTLLP